MKQTKKRLLCALLALCLALGGCGAPASGNLMAGLSKKAKTPAVDLNGSGALAVTGFGLDLFQRSLKMAPGEGALVSPFSVLSALAMTANGADGETLRQMEEVFGLSRDQLREYLAAYAASLPSGKDFQFHNANSLWIREGAVQVEKDFLQQNADYFGAGVFQEPFDGETLEKINQWVKENTHEMIPEILSELPPRAVLCLVNALAFEAQWEKVYEEFDVQQKIFTGEDGTESTVDMMISMEHSFLKDDASTGFMKPYAGGEYAFAALLPNQGVSLEEYLEGLTAEGLRNLLTGAQQKDVIGGIPKFKQEYSASLAGLLWEMGMADGFDPEKADFSQMGKAAGGDPLYIGDVVHKTYISVFEQGTKAGAATAVIMEAGSAMLDEPERVYLDRPFLYLIVDTKTMLPIFLGAAYAPEA